MRGAQTLVFLRIDEPLRLFRRPARFIEFEFAMDALEHAQLIIGIENLEILDQARFAPVRLEQAVRKTVKRADPHAASIYASWGMDTEQVVDTLAHFARGLVGKRHRENAVRRHTLGLHEPGDTMHEHARLTRARTCEHEHIARLRSDGLALRIVEIVENMGDVHARILSDRLLRGRPTVA